MSPSRYAVLASCGGMLLLACDDRVIYPDGSGGAGTGLDSSAVGTGGYTDCSTPSGLRVCLGPNACDSLDNCACIPGDFQDDSVLGVCTLGPPNEEEPWHTHYTECPDGYLLMGNYLFCVPEEIAQMFCRYDQAQYISCMDMGAYDCAGLPQPTDCPSTAGIRLCGDACGPCGPGEICHGRSNQHQYSMCVPAAGGSACTRAGPDCGSGQACFIFTVEPADQPRADSRGMCLPVAQCLAAAAELPGGGECIGG